MEIRVVGYFSPELDSPTLKDRRGLIVHRREILLVQDELAGGNKPTI